MAKLVIDPITRIEGHLRIEVEIDDGKVSKAWSSSTMFRGLETILKGRAAARREVALYLSIIADLDPTLDLDPELKARLKSAAAAYDFQQVASYVNDDMLRRLAFAGTPTEIAEQAATLFEAGTQRVEFGTPHGLTATEGIRLLGEQVLPALQGRYIE